MLIFGGASDEGANTAMQDIRYLHFLMPRPTYRHGAEYNLTGLEHTRYMRVTYMHRSSAS